MRARVRAICIRRMPWIYGILHTFTSNPCALTYDSVENSYDNLCVQDFRLWQGLRSNRFRYSLPVLKIYSMRNTCNVQIFSAGSEYWNAAKQ